MNKVVDRFLVFLLAVLVIVTVALTIFYFMRSEEVFSFSDGKDDSLVRYVNTGETLDITVYRTYATKDTYTLISTDETVLKLKERVSDNVFRFETTEKGGKVEVLLQTSNPKYAGLSLTVRVGDGTESNPYFVRNYDDLANIGNTTKFALNLNYLQVADIDMSLGTTSWSPIGWAQESCFEGVYNGNGHFINNFTMTNIAPSDETTGTGGSETVAESASGATSTEEANVFDAQVAGLFGAIGSNGVVTRINMNNVVINGAYDATAGVALMNAGVIQFVNIQGLSITNTKKSLDGDAGITVLNSGEAKANTYTARVMYCSVSGKITSRAQIVGGLVASNDACGLIKDNTVNVEINSTANDEHSAAYVGGVVGYNYAYYSDTSGVPQNSRASVLDNYAICKISAVDNNACVGAIIGANINRDGTYGVILNPTTEAQKSSNRVYGNYYLKNGTLAGIGFGNVAGNAYIANGLTESQLKSVATSADLERISQTDATADATLGYVTYSQSGAYTTWDFVKTWGIKSTENGGYPFIRSDASAMPVYVFNGIYQGKPVDPIEPIKPIDPTDPGEPVVPPETPIEPPVEPSATMTQAEFRALFEADLASNDNKEYTATYYITKDVVMTEAWVPIGTPEQPFNGTFIMGADAEIQNLYVTDCGLKHYGLFGFVGERAVINGVKINGVKIELSAEQDETIFVGAVIGYCEAKGVNDVGYSLIIVMNNKTLVQGVAENGFDKIAVSNKKAAVVGGAIGYLGSKKYAYDLTVSLNITVSACSEQVLVGGVLGENKGYADSCEYLGNLNTENDTFGYAIDTKSNGNALVYTGGIVGVNMATLCGSSFQGKIVTKTAENVLAGGVAGFSEGKIERCSAKKAVIDGGYYVGGIVGKFAVNDLLVTNNNPASFVGISRSYAAGSLSGKKVGGLAGLNECGTIKDCYTTAALSGELMAGFVAELPYKSEANCGKVAYCYSSATFDTKAGDAYWESGSVIRQTNGWWSGNKKLAGYVENCIYNINDHIEAESAKIDSIERQYSYFILSEGFACDDGRNTDEDCKKISTFTGRGDGFDITVWNLVDGKYPQLLNVK